MYLFVSTPVIPCLGAFVMSGCYKFEGVRTHITGVFTNKFPTDAIRGAGRPEATLDRALEMLDMDAFRAEQATLREHGTLRGVGFSTYTEICGLAPSRAVGPKGFGLGIGLYESALVRVHPTGTVTVPVGCTRTSADSYRPMPRPKPFGPTARDGARPQISVYVLKPTPR